MGQLPPARITPSKIFEVTGVDYAGPFTIKKGHTRKPVLVKAYLTLFVCFATKAVHIEVVSDLMTEAFLATLKLFVLETTTLPKPSSLLRLHWYVTYLKISVSPFTERRCMSP